MFCRKCGKENADDAVYCQKCGVLLEPEDETRVSRRDEGREYQPPGSSHHPVGETPPPLLRQEGTSNDPIAPAAGSDKIFSISPTLKFVKAGYVLTAIAALLLMAAFTVFLPFVSTPVAVLIGFALFLVPAFYHFRQRLIRYNLTDTTVEIDSGLLSRNTRNIPLRRVQDVTVSASIWQRLLGFGDIVIDNASEDGGKVVIKNIDSPRHYADMLLRQMRMLDR